MTAKNLTYSRAATMDSGTVLSELSTRRDGLPKRERAPRLDAIGPNDIARERKNARTILSRQLRSPFAFLLTGAAAVALMTGDIQNAVMIALFISINTALGFFQEFRAEQAVAALSEYWEHTANVLRDGKAVTIPAKDLVPGDIVRLSAGDRIPADVRFIQGTDLTVDESVLTGESRSVLKGSEPIEPAPKDYYEATNIGFLGTLVLTGEADAAVFATGRTATLGELSTLVSETRSVSAFERSIGDFSRFIMKLVVVTLAFVFALNIGLKGVDRFSELLIFAIALTVGVIPEALPVVSTISLSNGSRMMAKKKVVVKRLSAINDLGSIDILCTDKTGTITQNALTVTAVRSGDEERCLRLALMGAPTAGSTKRPTNPFDLALWKNASGPIRGSAAASALIADLPFDPVRRRNTAAVTAPDGERLLIMRGSPDEVLKLCKDLPDQIALGRYLAEQGLSGNRVLAIATRPVAGEVGDIANEEHDMDYVGLISFADPLKADAVDAAKRAASLGVQIKILTGDAKDVAGSIALQMGLITDPHAVVTGAEFDAMSSEDRHAAIGRFHVFARMNPKQKFAVLGLLQEKNTVGFLGEGFNDAPGLKMANVAIAVEGASDIAKDAADVILLGKSLTVIFDGIEEGRRVFTNIIKYLKITLASNFGNFYAVAVASLFIDFLPMLPLQILLLNLLSDFPMITIAGDSVDKGELRKPKHYEVRDVILTATILGLVSSIFDFSTFALFKGFGDRTLQTLWFMESNLTEIALIFSLRTCLPFFRGSRIPKSIWMLAGIAALVTVAIPFVPAAASLFHFARPEAWQVGLVLFIVLCYFVATETVKHWLYRHRNAAGA